jgi:hypothetical protein
MNTPDFLSECERRGISITVDGQDLIVHPDTIESKTVDYIRSHKQEIIESLTPVWNGGTLESDACIHCKQPTSAMLATPGGLIGWCCQDCFSERVVKHG